MHVQIERSLSKLIKIYDEKFNLQPNVANATFKFLFIGKE